MKESRQSVFAIRSSWESAVFNTSDGLSPLAVKLVHIPDLPGISAPLALGDDHYPYTIVCMTTVFSNQSFNGKLGWFPLEGDTRQNISQLLHDMDLREKWVYLSQQWA